jgi:hypothetical protein
VLRKRWSVDPAAATGATSIAATTPFFRSAKTVTGVTPAMLRRTGSYPRAIRTEIGTGARPSGQPLSQQPDAVAAGQNIHNIGLKLSHKATQSAFHSH